MENKPVKLAILCSFNLDPIKNILLRTLREQGIEAQLYVSHYGQWEPDALNRGSALYSFAPDAVALFADMEDLLPVLHPGDMLPTIEESERRAAEAWARLDAVVARLLEALPPHTVILANSFAPQLATPLGVLEGNGGYSYAVAAERLNDKLRQRCDGESRLLYVEYAALVADLGRRNLYDRRMWYLGRMRLNREGLQCLSALWGRYLAALYTPRRKCLVLDLDNTLWGGVIGEDGLGGIALGHQETGLAYREFQMAVLGLAQRGVILAVCSKNNLNDAMQALVEHPDMVLRPENFACMEIGWAPKSEGLQRIAQRLNIGLDSLVFWDDNPLERELVRSWAPQVLVPEVPDDVADYAAYLLSLSCFDLLSLTSEDRKRGEMYRKQAERESFFAETPKGSLEEFYGSLQSVAVIAEAGEFALPRIAQLTRRTNQFNFTTRRYSEADVRGMYRDPAYRIFSLSLRDRFGDLGLVGAAIAIVRSEDEWELDTFLMSCRALGRQVEDAFLAFLVSEAGKYGAQLRGLFTPTAKNAPASEFLERLGLLSPPADGSAGFAIPQAGVPIPAWIEIERERTESERAIS